MEIVRGVFSTMLCGMVGGIAAFALMWAIMMLVQSAVDWWNDRRR